MNYILFDDQSWNNLLPLTYTRPIAELRIGVFTIKEKWDKIFNTNCSFLTQKYLSEKYKLVTQEDNLLINGSILPNNELIKEITQLNIKEALVSGDKLIAIRLSKSEIESLPFLKIENFFYAQQDYEIVNLVSEYQEINFPWEIFKQNKDQIGFDINLIKKSRNSHSISETNRVLEPENIFIEEGAKVEFAILNASAGPIYIGKNTEIMENAVIRGPFALCDNSVVKMSAKIYGATTIGPHCKVGGEINNTVFQGYSNKAHDGFLGNSVIGEWCNLGADTNNSNLKNNYAEVKIWNYSEERFIKTGLQFCGIIMGDHSKSAINTMFNTGTVVGVSANIFGAGFPRNFIPSFSWGGAHGFSEYGLFKAFEVVSIVMARRGLEFNETEKKILTQVFELTEVYRKY